MTEDENNDRRKEKTREEGVIKRCVLATNGKVWVNITQNNDDIEKR